MDPKERYKSKINGDWIDVALERALPGGAIDQSMSAKLDWEGLINPEFTVAQAGIGGNHGSVAYAADCWKLVSGTVSAAPGGGLVLNGTIRQTREAAVGFDAVASINVTSGTATVAYDDATKQFDITSSGGTIKRAHLGLQAITDWLKMPIVDNNIELAKCKAHYQRIPAGNMFSGFLVSATVATFSCPLMVQMRTAPAVRIADFSGSVATTSGALTAAGLISGLTMNAYFVLVATLNTNTLSLYVPTLMQFGNDLELIADTE